MKESESKQFREQIRILERQLGLLKKNNTNSSCQSVTLTQCHALVEIGRAKKISLKNLSTILSLDTSTTSRTVDSLVKKEYVQRISASTDRRSIEISLTNKGNKLFEDIESSMDFEFSNIYTLLPKEQRKQIGEALNTLIDAFNNYKN